MSGKNAVIITHFQEPDFQATYDNVRATCPDAKIVAFEDKCMMGPGRARHTAIGMAAEMGAQNVCIIDAHMRFRHRALQAMFDNVDKYPAAIYGCKCWHNEQCAFDVAKKPYSGAVFNLGATDVEPESTIPFAAKWASEGEYPTCIMGACYAFSIDWYKAIGAPLRLLHGWGTDEEVLSLCTHAAGGEIRYLGVECAHLYRTSRPAPPHHQVITWANRLQLLDLIPLSDALRADLKEKAWASKFPRDNAPACRAMMELTAADVAAIRQYLEAHGRALDWLAHGTRK